MSIYKITLYVPESHLEVVKESMFATGAGKIGDYDCCSWQVKGQGQFRPLQGSDAFIGELNQLETLEEYRVEMVCEQQHLTAAIAALIKAHPYETPAYDVMQTVDIRG